MEKSEEMAGIAAGNIKRLGLEEKVTILTGDGEEAIRQNMKKGDLFDMVFIDAAKSHYKRFLDASLPFCHENTLIVSDNVLLKGATAVSYTHLDVYKRQAKSYAPSVYFTEDGSGRTFRHRA